MMGKPSGVDVQVQIGTTNRWAAARFLETAENLSERFEKPLILEKARTLDHILNDSNHSWAFRFEKATNGAFDSLLGAVGENVCSEFNPMWDYYADVLAGARVQLRSEREIVERKRREDGIGIRSNKKSSVKNMFGLYEFEVEVVYSISENSRSESQLNLEVRDSLKRLSNVLQGKKYEVNGEERISWRWEQRLSESEGILKNLEATTREAYTAGKITKEKAEQIYLDARVALDIGINSNSHLKRKYGDSAVWGNYKGFNNMMEKWTFEEQKMIQKPKRESAMNINLREVGKSKPRMIDPIEEAGDYVFDKIAGGVKKLSSFVFRKGGKKSPDRGQRIGNESFREFMGRRVNESKPAVHQFGLDYIEFAGDYVFDGLAYCAGTIKDNLFKKRTPAIETPARDLNEFVQMRAYKFGEPRARGFFDGIESAFDSGMDNVIDYVKTASSSFSLRKIAESATATIGAYFADKF